MQFLILLALLLFHTSRVLGHPYLAQNTSVVAHPTSITEATLQPEPSERAILYQRRGYGEVIQARDTTTDTESTSTTETSTSETSTSSTTSTTSSTSTTSTSTTSTSTSTTSTSTSSSSSSTSTTSSSTSTSSTTASTSTSTTSTTTTSSSTTTSTATATSTSNAALDAWNRKGNIAAIVFGCCLISLFAGISILYCAQDRAKARRIAARELLQSSGTSSASSPPTTAKGTSTPDLKIDRSSLMFTNNPSTEYFPSAQSIPLVSNYHSHTPSASSQATTERDSTREHGARANNDEQTTRFV